MTITALGTQDLRSCSVAFVASRKGAILAHISAKGDEHVVSKMNTFADLYLRNKDELFPDQNETRILLAQIELVLGLVFISESHKSIISGKLKEIGLWKNSDEPDKYFIK